MFLCFNLQCFEIGGCCKDSGGKSLLELCSVVVFVCKKVVDIQNQMLVGFGYDVCVDYCSFCEQGIQCYVECYFGFVFIWGMFWVDKVKFVEYWFSGSVVEEVQLLVFVRCSDFVIMLWNC